MICPKGEAVVDHSTGLDLCYTDPARHITTAGEELDDLHRDLSDLSVGRVNLWHLCLSRPPPLVVVVFPRFPSSSFSLSASLSMVGGAFALLGVLCGRLGFRDDRVVESQLLRGLRLPNRYIFCQQLVLHRYHPPRRRRRCV